MIDVRQKNRCPTEWLDINSERKKIFPVGNNVQGRDVVTSLSYLSSLVGKLVRDSLFTTSKSYRRNCNTSEIIFTNLSGQDMTQSQFFKAEFNRFEFRVFLLLD